MLSEIADDLPTKVSAAEISRNFGLWQDRALAAPVVVTHRGRSRVVMISAGRYDDLCQGAGSVEVHGEAEARLSIITDQMMNSFVTFDEQLRYTSLNPAALAYYGLTREQMLGRSITNVFPEYIGSALVDYYSWTLRSGEAMTFETASPRFPDRKLLVRTFPISGGVGVIFANVTELQGLRKSVAELRSITSALAVEPLCCHVSLNVRGVVTSGGSDFSKLSGFEPEELIGRRIVEIFNPRDRAALMSAIERVLGAPGAVHLEAALLRKDQILTPVSIGMAPITRDVVPDGVTMIITSRTPHP